MKPFVNRLQVENFACVKSVDIPLTRIHAFIGPNDSGKSTLLRAVWTVATAAAGKAFPGPEQAPLSGNADISGYEDEHKWFRLGVGGIARSAGEPSALMGAQLVRLEPDALRRPSDLIPHIQPVAFQTTRGDGLAAVLDAMLSRHPEQFLALRTRFVQLFRGVERIEVQNSGDRRKVVGATLVNGERIGSREMSEGMLYWLAFKALQYATKPSILLIEEPENGLHPARIREIMTLLRDISAETQVLIATHSPLVINELKPDEVTIITRTAEAGTIATPMTKTKNFEQRSSIYALGELWLSYADGELERDLMPDTPKDTKAAG